MTAAEPTARRWSMPGYRHMYLLATLFLVIFVKPFITVEVPIVGLMGLLLYLNLIGCVVATARSRNQLILTGSLAFAAAACQTLWSQNQTGTTLTLFLGLTSVFYLAVAVQFVRAFFRDGEPVSGDGLAGAVAAYLLIGLVWAMLYVLLEWHRPGSFRFQVADDPTDLARFVGFSFTTLTTLGYGNIAPATRQADSLTTLQAVIGQLYLAIVLARLVASAIPRRPD